MAYFIANVTEHFFLLDLLFVKMFTQLGGTELNAGIMLNLFK